MAAAASNNRFAAALYRNKTPKVAVVLIYTLLEWALIAALLTNGLIAYLAAAFAAFFGLKPPCVLCSRVDHVFGRRRAIGELVCDGHAAEVSRLGYCSGHRRLAEACDMCEDCAAASRPAEDRALAVLSWMKRSERGERDLRCSCCGVSLESGFYSPFLLLKPSSWGVLDYPQTGKLSEEEEERSDDDDHHHHQVEEEQERDDSLAVENFDNLCEKKAVPVVDDDSLDLLTTMRAERGLIDEERLIPVELIDSSTLIQGERNSVRAEEEEDDRDCVGYILVENEDMALNSEEEDKVALLSIAEVSESRNLSLINVVEEEGCSSASQVVSISEEEPELQVEKEQAEDRDDVGYSLIENGDTSLDIGFVSEEDEEKVALLSTAERSKSQNLPLMNEKQGCSSSPQLVSMLEEELELLVESERAEDIDYVGYTLVENGDTTLEVGMVSEEEEEVALLLTAEVSKSQNLPLVNVVEEEGCPSAPQLGSISEEELEFQVEKEHAEDGDSVGHNLVENGDTTLDVGTITEEDGEKVALLSTANVSKSQNLHVVNVFEEEECSSAPQLVSILELELQVDRGHAEGFGEFQALEEDAKVLDAETDCEISIGSEICDHEESDVPSFNDVSVPESTCTDELCLASSDVIIDKEQVTEAEAPEENVARNANELFICTEINEVDDERVPETPSSVDSLRGFHKRFLFERRESGTESLDGSVASEFDGNEMPTVDHLKAALKAERKALSALYIELEEERSASAIAANQTMAMITRLQEEKAIMQMEAMQYQRMMEEQSEYDQEALQLLNELMMKKEKEKQELEKELEVYRKKVFIYEAKQRRKAAERRTLSASSSAGDSDDLSFESHDGEDCHNNHDEGDQGADHSGSDHEATEHLITLDESLADFEEERLSILDQLKALEKKLFSVDDDELKSKGDRHVSDENGHSFNEDYESYDDDANNFGFHNGFEHNLDTNGEIHHNPKAAVSGGKRLLPLFDASIGLDSENGLKPEYESKNGSPPSVSKSAVYDHKRLAIAEEVDNVYERLQALEADREFLKHCIRSLKKGDKGRDLLHEILQHLRDLRNVELRVRNTGDTLASLSA